VGRGLSCTRPTLDTWVLSPIHTYRAELGGGQAGVVAEIRNQPLELKRSRNRRSPLLIGLYISQRVLQALDAQSTVRALHAGSAQEGNPLVRPSASQSAALVVFKLALSTESTGCTNLIPGWR
jgi:hypothetical protein